MIIRFALILLSISISANAQTNIIPYMDGVPTMNGFEIMEDSLVIFDKPEGQITEISLICHKDCPSQLQASEFYKNTLSNLGWISINTNQYQKEQRQINFNYSYSKDINSPIIITFQSVS